MNDGVSPADGPRDEVRGEAARLETRLAAARDRLRALVPPEPSGDGVSGEPGFPTGGVTGSTRRGTAASGVGRIDDDENLRDLLRPAAARIARLTVLAGALAAGAPSASAGFGSGHPASSGLSEDAVAEAARSVARSQPHRGPR